MYDQIALQETLVKELGRKRFKNPSYSLRAFARQLGISSSSLSEIMNGKRRVSAKLALRIITRLDLTAEENEKLICLYQEEISNKKSTKASLNRDAITKQKNMLRLMAADYNTTAKWYYYGVLSLAETKDFKADPEWISERLNISLKESKEALERLIELGALGITDEGVSFKGINLKTTDEIKSLAVQSSHLNQMELAKKSLVNDPIDLRDFTSITFAIDVSKLQQAKLLIRDFRKRLSLLLESGNQSEVYIFSSYLYPVSKRKKEDENV